MADVEVRDSEVVAKIVAGDPEGLAAAYDKYADVLYTYCRSVLRDPADAADAVQDTFVIAASRLDGLRDPEKLRSWLYTVARNECMRVLRGNKDTSALDEAPDVIDDTIDIGADAERAELRALFRDASRGLNDSEREVIELSLRHKMEASEIAGVLGVSNNHAHSLLSRARTQMEACLGALLVGRSGRDDCGELSGLLKGWDGSLTVLLRKRLHRHIEHCSTCTSRRAFELQPAAFLGLPPLVAIAGALRWLTVPDPLKGKILALATGTSSAAAAHRAAVLHRAGSFNHHGFPHVVHAKAGAAHGASAKATSFLKTPQGQGTVAAVVLAIIAASTAAALTGNNSEHLSLANGGHGQGAGAGAGGGSGSGGGGGAGGSGGGGGGAGGGGAGGGSGSGHGGSGSGGSGSGTGGSGSGSGGSGSGSSPAGTQAGSSGGSSPTSGLSAPGTPSLPGGTTPGGTTPGSPSSGSSPSSPASPSSPSKPTPTGTVTSSGATPGVLTVGPGGTPITVTNSGNSPAYYTMTVSGGSGTVTASPSAGYLAPGKSQTVTLKTVSATAMGQTVSLEPSGQQWTVIAGWNNPSTPSVPGLPSLPFIPSTSSASATRVPTTPATPATPSTPTVPTTPSVPTPTAPAVPTPSLPNPITATTPATTPTTAAPSQTGPSKQTGTSQQPTPTAPSGSSPTCAVYAVLPTGLRSSLGGGSCP